MIYRIFSLCLCLLVFSAFLIPEKVEKKADKVIAKFYQTDTFSKEIITFSEEANRLTSSEFGQDNFFKITDGDTFLGYGYIGNAPSKTATFDYLVLFDKEMIVVKSKVLIYREEYGGEIGSKRWLRQFEGASSESEELKYNEDIIPISGATISVRSMTKAMNELFVSLKELQQLNLL
ncbi:MAG: FMN-binding protein [Flavobacteriaceae bacterium]|nr:FMN-binding protein [Flavobacteriaceae bacterium]